MNTMTYKGYLGSVAYSEKDQVFFGKIEGINGLVNFEGESVKELTEAFHEAVDDYLAYCEDEGIEPDKSYTGVLNVRLTPPVMLLSGVGNILIWLFDVNMYLGLSLLILHQMYGSPAECPFGVML